MRLFSDDSSRTQTVLNEINSIEGPLTTGGRCVDRAIKLWFRWRTGKMSLPDWSSFQPSNHPEFLPNALLCKRFCDSYLCVLVGEWAKLTVPEKINGKLVHESMPRADADNLIDRYDLAFQDKLPNYVEKSLDWRSANGIVGYRAVNLPFVCAKDEIDRMLVIFDFEMDPKRLAGAL